MNQVFVQDAGIEIEAFRSGRNHNVTTEQVEDARIVCFTVPNETLVTRRNGRVAMHGNTKYASHALRLGLQGLELMTTGRLTLPLTGSMLQSCMEVKRGEVAFSEALRRVDSVRDQLHSVMKRDAHVLKDGPNLLALNDWMVSAHYSHWETHAAD